MLIMYYSYVIPMLSIYNSYAIAMLMCVIHLSLFFNFL